MRGSKGTVVAACWRSCRVGGDESKMLLCRSVELSKVIRKAGLGWVASCFTASMGKVGKQLTLPACDCKDRAHVPWFALKDRQR